MINLIRRDGEYAIWTDPEVAERDGRCLAIGADFEAVKAEAIEELKDELAAVQSLTADNAE